MLCSSSLSHPSSPEPQMPSGSCDFFSPKSFVSFFSSSFYLFEYDVEIDLFFNPNASPYPKIVRTTDFVLFFWFKIKFFFASKPQITKIHYSELRSNPYRFSQRKSLMWLYTPSVHCKSSVLLLCSFTTDFPSGTLVWTPCKGFRPFWKALA